MVLDADGRTLYVMGVTDAADHQQSETAVMCL
jgi:hypothetical protein